MTRIELNPDLGPDTVGEIYTVTIGSKEFGHTVTQSDLDKADPMGSVLGALETLIEAVRPHSLGAKITGSGGGGCMMALTYNPERVAQMIEMSGGRAIITPMYCDGARILSS